MRRSVLAVALAAALTAAGAGIAVVLWSAGAEDPADVVATASGSPTAEPVSASDFCYVEAMIFYRVEADELATVVSAADGVDDDVRDFAEEIAAAQGTELEGLRERYVEWVPARPLEQTDDGACSGHGEHASMPGIPTRTQRGELSAADGAAAEALFLELIAGLNAGVQDLAAQTLDAPSHPLVAESARRTLDEAVAEAAVIARLRG